MSYTLIGHQRLDTAAASITFSNIPQTFTDLYLLVSARSAMADVGQAINNNIQIRLNGDASNHSARQLFGTGTSAGSGTLSYASLGYIPTVFATANTFGSSSAYIPNYRSNTTKSISVEGAAEGNTAGMFMAIEAGLWNQTAAVTSITLLAAGSNNLQSGSSATLYGINRTQAIGRSPQAVGGSITYANGHWVHTFTGSGSFVPFNNMEAEFLIVSGGGGGTGDLSGGGGARALTASSALTSNTLYPVVVGAGGAGGSGGSGGVDGNASSFASNTCLGGPRAPEGSTSRPGGAGSVTVNGVTTNYVGGPGGGGAATFPSREWRYGGGGGGAGGNGRDGNSVSGSSNGTGGAGGSGILSSITGTSREYAGGGGGGAFSTGGSATGGGAPGSSYTGTQSTSDGQAGTANTGGGGGGGSGLVNVMGTTGGAGGSGVVIVRYRG